MFNDASEEEKSKHDFRLDSSAMDKMDAVRKAFVDVLLSQACMEALRRNDMCVTKEDVVSAAQTILKAR